MDEPSVYNDAGRVPAAVPQPKPGLLLELLLSDAATDVEVVTRELGLRNEMLERLQRALDRMACAQAVLETVREIAATGCSQRQLRADGDNVDGERVATARVNAVRVMRAAVGLLAREWPDDYPVGAVEWRMLEEAAREGLESTRL
jgi:hypothetical protein